MNKKTIGFFSGIAVFAIIYFLPIAGLSAKGQMDLALSLMTVVWWATPNRATRVRWWDLLNVAHYYERGDTVTGLFVGVDWFNYVARNWGVLDCGGS